MYFYQLRKSYYKFNPIGLITSKFFHPFSTFPHLVFLIIKNYKYYQSKEQLTQL